MLCLDVKAKCFGTLLKYVFWRYVFWGMLTTAFGVFEPVIGSLVSHGFHRFRKYIKNKYIPIWDRERTSDEEKKIDIFR